MRPIKWMFFGSAVGAATMYLFDPKRGARRRHGLSDRVRRALGGVGDVAGKAKRDVENRLHGVSARMHGSPSSRPGRTALSAMTPERRLLEGGGGALLALYGINRGGVIGKAAIVAGLALVARSTVQRDRGLIRVQKTMTIESPIDEVFAFWSRFENFPRFMEHVLEVKTDGPRSHWRVKGPAGLPITWDATVVEMIENRTIGWRSIDGSAVQHRGEVHFEAIDDRTTRINVHMAYQPPAGAFGHAVAAFLLGDPKTLMDADLLRMKSLLEAGKASSRGRENRDHLH